MLYRYLKWTQDSISSDQLLQNLVSLFSYLLIKTSGDVEEALELLGFAAKEFKLTDDKPGADGFIEMLTQNGIIEKKGELHVLTIKGIQRVRRDALREVFTSLRKGSAGNHETTHGGTGTDRFSDTRKWVLGDAPTNIDLTATLKNAFRRDGIDDFTLREEDLEVYETEHLNSCATVVMLDISHSMILYGEDRITPAKHVALALSELIMQKFPKDYLALVTFGDDAKLVTLAELPYLRVGPYHTNTRAGLRMARNILGRKRNVNKQIFMITDGKPSAIFEENGRLYKNSYGLDPRIVNKTLDEAVACRRDKITISTFMVARDPYLIDFVDELTRANRGRAYFADPRELGKFMFIDYIRNRRKKFDLF